MDEPLVRVLLIDATPAKRSGIAQSLRQHARFKIDCIADAAALDRVDVRDYDVAIVSFHLPDATGLDVYAGLQTRNPELPTVLLLDASDEAVVPQALALGFDGYIIRVGDYQTRLLAAIERARTYRIERRSARQTDEQMREMFERAPVGMYWMDSDGRFTRVNPALARICGCESVAELLTHKCEDFFTRSDEYEAWRARYLKEGAVSDFEGRARRIDGTVIWVRNSGRVVRDAVGAVLYFEGTIEDITARRQMQRALRESQSFLEQAQDVAGIGSWVSGLGADTSLWWSRQSYRIFGVSENTPVDVERFFAAVHSEDRESVRRAVQKAIDTHTPYSINHRVLLPDGRLRWVFERAEIIFDSSNQPVKMIGVVQDITERVEREAAVLRDKELLEQIIDSLPGTFCILDEAGGILRWNRWFERQCGYSAGEIRTLRWASLIPPDDRPWFAALREATRHSENLHVDTTLRARDGRVTELHCTARAIDVDGQRCVVLTGFDIGERKRAEEELRLLKTIALAVSEETNDLRSVLEVVLRKVCDATGWAVGEAWLPETDGVGLYFSDAAYARTQVLQAFVQARRGQRQLGDEGLIGRVWREREPWWLASVDDPMFPQPASARAVGLQTAIGMPILAGDAVVAVLAFFMDRSSPDDRRLMDVVAGAVAQLGHMVQRKSAEARLQYLAQFDGLTGLPNRSLFMDRLQQALIEAARHERRVGVAFLDVDRFKNVNETLGHHVGDELIKVVAARLTDVLREGDTVARLSGDEFAVVLADMAQIDDAARLVRKMAEVFDKPFSVGEREIYVTASIGVTCFPDDDKEAAGLLRNAEVAMYRAKEAGRNNFQFFSADMSTRAIEDLTLESDLRHAIERKEFELHYQPLVDSRTGDIVGLEALVRWRHPERGMIPPMQFIPLAEESGLIVSIGEWVLRTACHQCQQWRHAGSPALRIAVNLSARQFQQPGLDDLVIGILKETGLEPSALELELTESVIMQSSRETLAVMQRLSDLGVAFSIDDFGTGYSNLSYLKRFPVDTLKVDRSFVRDIPDDLDDAAIADAIITMAHSLGMQVIAEGVETEQQRVFMRSHGCDLLQGYYFSKPLPAVDLALLLGHHRPLPLSKKIA